MARVFGFAVATAISCLSSLAVAGFAEQASFGSPLQGQAGPLVVPAKSKCKLKVVCDHSLPADACKHPPCCKTWHLKKVCEPKDGGAKAPPADAGAQAPQPACALGIDPKTGQCRCPAGQVNYSDGRCGRPCGYGMSGEPPNCKCLNGATLQVTGPTTKACRCPNGKPPVDIGGGYDCPDWKP